MCVDHVRALLADVAGDAGAATGLFENAVALLRSAGYKAVLVWTLHDYAGFLTQRNQAGDAERASAMWDEAMLLARELGMHPLTERVIARKKILRA